MVDPCDLGAVELRRRIGVRRISPVELLESCIARIEAVNPALNAVVATDFARARAEAEAAEAAVRAGDDLGLLHGLPVAIKDLEATEGLRTTYGSLIYKDYIPPKDDRLVAAVRAAGGIVIAKTNTPEFGAGANTRNSVYGATGNPFDPSLTCGGSSGGSAVALATGMAPLASGSDFGGSLRTPAGFCGVVGFRPSPGTVPDENRVVGLSPFAVLGPMGRDVADAALLLAALIDDDARDPFTNALDPALEETPGPCDLASVRAAFSEDLGCAPVAEEIRVVFRERREKLSALFARVEHGDPPLGPAHEVFEILRGVNFLAAHKERVEKHRDLLGPNVIDNTERARAYTAADVAWAHAEQTKLYRRTQRLFDDVDILICPACSVSPFPHAQWAISEIDGRPMETYMRWLAITYGITLTTHPVVVVPCGRDGRGLPFGLQIVGPHGGDAYVLRVARALESVMAEDTELARPRPDLARLAAAGKATA